MSWTLSDAQEAEWLEGRSGTEHWWCPCEQEEVELVEGEEPVCPSCNSPLEEL